MPAVSHRVDVTVAERPVDGRGRPSSQNPRPLTAIRSRLKTTSSAQTEQLARREDAAGCCGLLPNVPTAGDLAQSAREILTGYKDPQGTEQH